MLTETLAQYSLADLGAEVRSGLTRLGQKELPSKYLYDDVGSALFEVITLLPEYGLSRADERLLREHAAEVVQRLSPGQLIVTELGSGSGKKTRWILEALRLRQPTVYCPIEISPTALAQCAKEFADMNGVTVCGLEQPYLEGLQAVAAGREPHERLLVLFLGSTIGNFDREPAEQFLRNVRSILRAGDALLISADLVKPAAMVQLAYDDPLGVTAAFNLNLLARLNRKLGADFNLGNFRHLARYNETAHRVEMHLHSLRDQTVTIPGADCAISFAKDETIWTESSYKYQPEEVVEMARRSGFRKEAQWVDVEWPFAQTLVIAED
jgi:dimethylhistidine N-methyltransferase